MVILQAVLFERLNHVQGREALRFQVDETLGECAQIRRTDSRGSRRQQAQHPGVGPVYAAFL